MNIGIVVFDQFTDLDFYLPWDLLNRVRLLNLSADWKVEILADQRSCVSAAGLELKSTKPYQFANECQGLLFCSGIKTRELIRDRSFLDNFKLDPQVQSVAAIDSGALILAAMGLLKNRKATTYPTAFDALREFEAEPIKSPFVEDTVATAARCLSGDKLALWIIGRLCGKETADKVYDSVKPLTCP